LLGWSHKEHERKAASERGHGRFASVERSLGMQSCVRLFAFREFGCLGACIEGLGFLAL